MADNEDLDEDLFADLYEDDKSKVKTEQVVPSIEVPALAPTGIPSGIQTTSEPVDPSDVGSAVKDEPLDHSSTEQNGHAMALDQSQPASGMPEHGAEQNRRPSSDDKTPEERRQMYAQEQNDPNAFFNKEDGKMFIGGLNWETTDEGMKAYFSQFGEVVDCTVMRDGTTGRSRGFGFLTFADPKVVSVVMTKEHFLDGKIIDPKRAIPREEQERTSKIFVGGVSQDATEEQFHDFFTQFGAVVDATLMMDKDTGRPRGFGFVTFANEAAVDNALSQPLSILGKPVEVKKAQPRGGGGYRDDDDRPGRFGRGGGRGGYGRDRDDRYHDNYDRDRDNRGNNDNYNQGGMPSQMTPQMMASYWQKMQQMYQAMQQQFQAKQAAGANAAAGDQTVQQNMMMNPMMMQMMAAQMQRNAGGSPAPGGNAMAGGAGGMNPAMMAQMQQFAMLQQQQQMAAMQQMQQAQQAQQAQQQGGMGRSNLSATEQLAFEQRKYENQEHRGGTPNRGGGGQQGGRGGYRNYGQHGGGPQSWEGMYDGEPQPGAGRNSPSFNKGPQSAPPANAPTGPKNASRGAGGGYRGGRGGGHGGRGFHPYAR